MTGVFITWCYREPTTEKYRLKVGVTIAKATLSTSSSMLVLCPEEQFHFMLNPTSDGTKSTGISLTAAGQFIERFFFFFSLRPYR